MSNRGQRLHRGQSLLQHGKFISVIEDYVRDHIYDEIVHPQMLTPNLSNKAHSHAVKIGNKIEVYLEAREWNERIGSKFNPQTLSVITAMELVKIQHKQSKQLNQLKEQNKLLKESLIKYQKSDMKYQ